MNNSFYECTIKYGKVQEDGRQKEASEKYLVEAVNFSEAETRITEEMQQYVSGEFDVTAIRRCQFSEIFESKDVAADRWYKAKLAFTYLDEKTGKEKRTPTVVMVCAKDFDDARNVIEEGMKGSVADWEKAVLSETPILDVYRYEK